MTGTGTGTEGVSMSDGCEGMNIGLGESVGQNLGLGLGLRFERTTAEKLNNSLWRWLCVYVRE